MKEIKFLHFSDLHLDMPFSGIHQGNGTSSAKRQDLKDVFGKIISIAARESIDIMLISGDLYEHDYVRRSTINFINEAFASIPDTKIFIAPGNHDPYVPSSFYKNYKWSSNVYVLGLDKPSVLINELDACIYGVGFNTFHQDNCPLNLLPDTMPNLTNILLIHATVDMMIDSGRYNPVTSSQLEALSMDYIALGHFHNRIDNYKNLNIYNPGSPEPLGFDEPGEHGMYIGTIKQKGLVNVEFVPLAKRSYKTMDIDISECCTNEQICSRITGLTDKYNPGANLFKITLKGIIEDKFTVDTGSISSLIKDKFFSISIKDESRTGYNLAQMAYEQGIKGLYAKKMYELIIKANSQDEKRMLENALYYGIEALEKGSVYIYED